MRTPSASTSPPRTSPTWSATSRPSTLLTVSRSTSTASPSKQIREQSAYPGLRVRVNAAIGPWKGTAVWDVSTGDPIIPAPRAVTIERVAGEPITLLGYAPETTLAEKGVTILERGITSTRWRDYVDIVQLARQGIDSDLLLHSARAVARQRGVPLDATAPHVEGYGRIGQTKWAAWRRKEKLEAVSEAHLDDQMILVASFLDPIFAKRDPETLTTAAL